MSESHIIKITSKAKSQIEHLTRDHIGIDLEGKLYELIIEWYCKGVDVGIRTERDYMERRKNDENRAV